LRTQRTPWRTIQATPHNANSAAANQAPLQKALCQASRFNVANADELGVGVTVAGPPGVADGRGVDVGGCSIKTVGVCGGTVGRSSIGVTVASGVGVSAGRELRITYGKN
jgi:hypothetical protein